MLELFIFPKVTVHSFIEIAEYWSRSAVSKQFFSITWLLLKHNCEYWQIRFAFFKLFSDVVVLAWVTSTYGIGFMYRSENLFTCKWRLAV